MRVRGLTSGDFFSLLSVNCFDIADAGL